MARNIQRGTMTFVTDNDGNLVGYEKRDSTINSVVSGALSEDGVPVVTDIRTDPVWKDMLAPVGGAGVPNSSAPVAGDFGPAHVPQRREYSFAVGDYVFIQPFHTNHDIVPGGEAYLHVHWSTNGVSTGLVRWELTVMRAKGHDQANFGAPTVTLIEQAASGTAWRHMVSETDTPLIMTEPDELIIVTLRRVAPSAGSNADAVFGLQVDLHYQADRNGTPQKAPDFYVR